MLFKNTYKNKIFLELFPPFTYENLPAHKSIYFTRLERGLVFHVFFPSKRRGSLPYMYDVLNAEWEAQHCTVLLRALLFVVVAVVCNNNRKYP